MTQISGGTVRLLERVKTGDYQHREAEVTISFTVDDGDDYIGLVDTAEALVQARVRKILRQPVPDQEPRVPAQSLAVASEVIKRDAEVLADPKMDDKLPYPDAAPDLAADMAKLQAKPYVKLISDDDLQKAFGACRKRTDNLDEMKRIISQYSTNVKIPGIPQERRQEVLDALLAVQKVA